jgi:hypothetical protein
LAEVRAEGDAPDPAILFSLARGPMVTVMTAKQAAADNIELSAA